MHKRTLTQFPWAGYQYFCKAKKRQPSHLLHCEQILLSEQHFGLQSYRFSIKTPLSLEKQLGITGTRPKKLPFRPFVARDDIFLVGRSMFGDVSDTAPFSKLPLRQECFFHTRSWRKYVYRWLIPWIG